MLAVLTELKSRGLEDILIGCVDGFKGFPEAIEAGYPNCQVQLCLVYMECNSMKLVPYKGYKEVAADLKLIYHRATEADAAQQLVHFGEKWDTKYSKIAKSWTSNWHNLIAIYHYPPDIRKAIYTINAIESLNSVVRKVTCNRKVFPDDDSARKVVYLAIH